MSEQQDKQEQPRNVHSAVNPEACFEMGKRYGWELLGWQITHDPILKVDCVFAGEQTSFEDDRYE